MLLFPFAGFVHECEPKANCANICLKFCSVSSNSVYSLGTIKAKWWQSEGNDVLVQKSAMYSHVRLYILLAEKACGYFISSSRLDSKEASTFYSCLSFCLVLLGHVLCGV